jgi:hypothetical protein
MIEKVHDHIIAEIEQSNRTDTIVVVVTLLFNVIALCSNSTVAAIFFSSWSGDVSNFGINLYLIVFVLLTVLLNAIAFIGMLTGRKTREKLLNGLVSMYTDNEVEKYYDKSLISNYRTRYYIFGSIMILFALASIIVPLILRLFRI